jgi:peptide chain release factor subunit 1
MWFLFFVEKKIVPSFFGRRQTVLTKSELDELLNFKSDDPVLSVYLNTDPLAGGGDHYKLRLKGMLKEADLPDDVRLVERYFEHEYDWSGRSVAVFSSAGGAFFRVYSLAVPLRSRVRVNSRPYVKPLVDLFDSYGSYGVALVDQQETRLFFFHLGELREESELIGKDIRRTKSGGGSQAAGRRGGTAGMTQHTAEQAERNMREAAGYVVRFFRENRVRRVLIGGTDDNVAMFSSLLPKSWQSLVVGTFPMDMNASHTEVLERTVEIAAREERKREARLVDQVVTAAAKGQGGVVRLEDTLGAVYEGRVQTLALLDGLREPGYRCRGCGYVTVQVLDECPFCENSFDEISDAVEMAVRRVMQDGGEVEVVHQNEKLQNAGGIGAILRY